jgi:hypothetical protein
MKRLSPFYACAGFEILRYFTLSWALGQLFSRFPPQILRFVAAPNLLFGVAFFFLAMDPVRYGVYRPLILAGKAVAVFAALVSVPRLAGLDGERMRVSLSVLAALALVVVWDISSALVLLLRNFPVAEIVDNSTASTEPEVVEVD